MMQCAVDVLTGCYPWTAVVYCRVGKCDPTCQILLRLHIVIAIILMPWKIFSRAWSLIYQLIPVQAHLRADQILHQIAHHRMLRKTTGLL